MGITSTVMATTLALTGVVAISAFNPEGPPPGHTGGFGEPTCITCHQGSDLNAFGGRVTIEGLPNEYVQGERYLLTVFLEAEETDLAGFQLAARYRTGGEEGLNAGKIHPVDDRVAISIGTNGLQYVHQTRQGSYMSAPDSTSWSMEWIAPSTGNSVVFHVAANSGNGDNSPLSDLVYTADLSVDAGPSPLGWRILLFSALPLLLLMALWVVGLSIFRR
jgi:hypothetical protein